MLPSSNRRWRNMTLLITTVAAIDLTPQGCDRAIPNFLVGCCEAVE